MKSVWNNEIKERSTERTAASVPMWEMVFCQNGWTVMLMTTAALDQYWMNALGDFMFSENYLKKWTMFCEKKPINITNSSSRCPSNLWTERNRTEHEKFNNRKRKQMKRRCRNWERKEKWRNFLLKTWVTGKNTLN